MRILQKASKDTYLRKVRERARELAGILTRSAFNSHYRLHIAERATNPD